MSKNRKFWKSHAKESLRGRWGLAILGMLAASAMNFAGNYLASGLFPGESVPALVLSQVFMFIVSLIGMILSTGYCYMLLNMSRGRRAVLADVFYLFRNQPDRVLVAGLVVSLLDTVVMLPLNYWTIMTNPEAQTFEAQLAWLQTAMLLLILGMILGILIKLPLVLTFYLLADNPEMGGVEALKTSIRLMRGRKWKYVVLQLSYLPLVVLAVFTLYIAFLWLLPYMQAVDTAFYMDILGEFDRTEPGYDDGGRYLSESSAGDDYNAEA